MSYSNQKIMFIILLTQNHFLNIFIHLFLNFYHNFFHFYNYDNSYYDDSTYLIFVPLDHDILVFSHKIHRIAKEK
jgi:hypothetical protein